MKNKYELKNTQPYRDLKINRGALLSVLDSCISLRYTYSEYIYALNFAEFQLLNQYIYEFRKHSFLTFFFYGNILEDDPKILNFLKIINRGKIWENTVVTEA